MAKQITNSDIFRAINDFREEAKDCFISKDRYNAEVPPMKSDLRRITWLVLSAVVLALLSIVVKNVDVLAMIVK